MPRSNRDRSLEPLGNSSYCRHPERSEGGFEREVCEVLRRGKIHHAHHAVSYQVRLPDGKLVRCTPDITMGTWNVEPHGPQYMCAGFIEKWKAFRVQYPDKKTMLITTDFGIPSVPADVFDTVISDENFKAMFG